VKLLFLNLILFFPIPTPIYDPIKKKKKIVPHWNNNSIYYYSIKYLKKTRKSLLFIFYNVLNYIELFQKLSVKSKTELIQLFLKWLKLKNNSF
jgi:hypothetical protein